jgi:SNF2 family DNA or RNA helicase
MATLRFSISNSSKVRIEPVGEIHTSEWESVVEWWSLGRRFDAIPTFIDVNISDLSQRKIWLRENWKNLGNELIIEDDVKEALKSSNNLKDDFIRLSERNKIDVSNTSLNEIKLNISLTEFQKKNIINLLDMNNGANFSVPGAGKTLTTLAVWEHFRVSKIITNLLIICPRSAFEAWETDVKKLQNKPTIKLFDENSIDSKIQIIYVNYEQLENDHKLKRLIGWLQLNPTMLVIDEAHRIKGGGSSIRWRACRELAIHARRVDLLTGTPMPQSQDDLRNLLSLSWTGIPREFFTESLLSNLKRDGIFVRTTKKELLLPSMKITQIELPMGIVQKEVYSALRHSFAGQFDVSSSDINYFSSKGKAVMTLIAVATNPGLLMKSVREDAYLGLFWPPKELKGSERLMSVLHDYALHEMPEKYKWIARFVEKATREGRKILIWSTFIANLLALKRLLEPYDPAIIYGISSEDDRKAQLNKFRNSLSCSVLLSNPQTLGEGVSLHKECHDAIYLDRNYNAGLYLQSLDRIHRLGLPENQETNIYILSTSGTIDQRIARRLEDKIQRLGFYLNDSGLVEVSIPGIDDEVLPEGMLGLDDIDFNDIYQHLMENDR